MSLFIDSLEQLSRTFPHPIGFTAAQSASSGPKIQLIVSLEADSVDKLIEHLVGADAGLLSLSKPVTDVKVLQKLAKAVPDIPWGGRLQSGQADIKSLVKARADFIVFPSDSATLTVLEDDVTGKIVEVESTINENLLRAVNQLPVDAVLVVAGKEDSALTWQNLMTFRRFADLLTKPLLFSIPSEVTAVELQVAWDAGVSAVVVKIKAGRDQDRIKELREIIDNLTLPSAKRQGIEPRLSRTDREPSVLTSDEQEDE